MLRLNLGPRSYDIAIVHRSGDLAHLRERCPAISAVIIADENVLPHVETVAKSLNAAGFMPTVATVTPGEASKSLAVAARLYDALAQLPADRTTPIVAVGGGVVGDLAGSSWRHLASRRAAAHGADVAISNGRFVSRR